MCTVPTTAQKRDEATGSQLCRALDGEQKEGQGHAKLRSGYAQAALLPPLGCIFIQLKHKVQGGSKGL